MDFLGELTITGLCLSRQHEALWVLDKMCKLRLRLDTFTYNNVLKAYRGAGNCEGETRGTDRSHLLFSFPVRFSHSKCIVAANHLGVFLDVVFPQCVLASFSLCCVYVSR